MDADPRYAQRDAGERILDEEVSGVVEEVRRHLDELRSTVGS